MKHNLLRFNFFLISAFLVGTMAPLWAETILDENCLCITSNSTSTYPWVKFQKSVSTESPNVDKATDLEMYYSRDGGSTWTRWTDPTVAVNFSTTGSASGKSMIMLKGHNHRGFGQKEGLSSWQLVCYTNYKYEVKGNLMCLIDSDDEVPMPKYCFDKFFSGIGGYLTSCAGLVLPAKTLSEGCYRNLFSGCTAMGGATPDLSVATNIPTNSLRNMFYNCQALTRLTSLPQASTIDPYGCANMFYQCKSLSGTLPDIIASRIDDHGCYHMFFMNNLGNAFATPCAMPNLKSIAPYGCCGMYQGCQAMTSSVEMNLDVADVYSCHSMFDSCLSMTTILPLRARCVAERAWAHMFFLTSHKDKTSATTVQSISVDTVNAYGCYEMFKSNLTTTGSLHFDYNRLTYINALYLGVVDTSGCEGMFYSCQRLDSVPKIKTQRVAHRGFYQMFYNNYQLATIGKVSIDTIESYGCYQMFKSETARGSASWADTLVLDVIGDHGCEEMFYNWTYMDFSATERMNLSRVGVYGCANMFTNCANAITKMDVPAITVKTTVGERGMYQMYYNCDNIDSLRTIKARNVEKEGMREMFAFGLQSLNPQTNKIEIDTIGEMGCYQMFYSPVNTPSQMQITPTFTAKLVKRQGCEQMFHWNKNIRTYRPVTCQRLEERGWYQMFLHTGGDQNKAWASTIEGIKADTVGDYGCYQMFYGNFTTTTSPKYWSVLSSIKSLYFNVIGNHGLEGMFQYCQFLLTEVPQLHVKKLGECALNNMYLNCTKLATMNDITVDEIAGNSAMTNMFNGCTALTSVGNITINEVGEDCCTNMFNGGFAAECTIGNITANIVHPRGMQSMFNGRGNLAGIGAISLDNLEVNASEQMFSGCTGLTTTGAISIGATSQSSCQQMFNNCNKLTAVPSLTIGNIGPHACQQMFNGCTALTFTGAVTLPQDKIETFGCAQMFMACKGLTAAASLGATDLEDSVYYQMYRECTELLTPPASLPALVVPNGGYEQMFFGCGKLTSGPTIAATDISTDGCANMFSKCSALETIPNMTALQRIGKEGCWEMFSSCTSLTSIPAKTVESIDDHGCYQMFAECSNLGAVDNLHAGNIGTHGCERMFMNCANLTTVSNLGATTIGENGCYQMFLRDRYIASVNTISATTVGGYGCAEMFAEDSGLKDKATAPTITNLSFGTIGDHGCYRMFYVKYNSNTNYNYWASLNGFTAGHVGKYGCAEMFLDIKTDNTTLVANNKFQSATNISIGITDENALYRMFRSCTALNTLGLKFTSNSVGPYACREMFCECSALPSSQLPILSATDLSEGSYQNMFNGCSSLSSAPALPSMHIPNYVYDGMFCNSGLTSIPALPATTVGKYSYRNMFNGCTSFNSTISLGAKHIDEGGCQGMFQRCTSLQTIPALTIDEIGSYGCNYMFANCTILNVVGELTLGEVGDHGCAQMFNISICGAPKTYLEKNTTVSISINKVGPYGCYQMFRCEGNYSSTSSTAGASVLRQIAKLELGEISRYACCEMFYNCRYMHTIPNILPIMNLYEGCYQGMFQECVSVGTAPKLPATTLAPFCYRNMFKSTSISSAPDLLADKMETSCYESMFENCTSLTSAPNLPSKQLAPRCYANMFNGCSNSSFTTAQTELPATKLANACYLGMFQGCSSLTTSPVLCAPKFEDANGTPTTQAYYQMFYGCSKLTKISTYLESWDGYVQSDANCNTYSWVRDVSNLGTFACTSDLDKTKYGSSNTYASFMPKYSSYKWTVTAIQRMTFNPNGGTWDGIDNTRKVMTPPLSQQPVPMKQGYIFTEWNTAADGSGETLDWTTSPEGDNTYYAQYTPIREFIYARWEQNGVVIHTTLNATKCTILMQQSNQSTEVTLSACQPTGCPGEYILPIDPTTLQENQNKLMNLIFKDASDKEIGVIVVRIPYVVTNNERSSMMPTTEETDIWITNGSTFIVNEDAAARNIYVDGGCKLVVEEGVTLHTNDLILRAGKFSKEGVYSFTYPQLVVNGSVINTSGMVNLDYALDLNQFYTLCLPYGMNLGDASFDDGSDAVKNMQVQQYNGEKRVSDKRVSGWEDLWNPNMGGSLFPDLQAGKGYIVKARDRRFKMDGSSTYMRRANTVIRFPMIVDLSHGEQTVDGTRTIDVYAWGMEDGRLKDDVAPNDAGWNLVGNPFLADIEIAKGLVKDNGIGLLVKQDDYSYIWQGNNRYAVIPSNDGQSYEQIILNGTTLPAFKNFFVQIGTGDVLSFSIAKRAQDAPGRVVENEIREIMVGIRLSGKGKQDRLGILLSEDYSTEYEFNADLDKWKNKSLNLYAQVGTYDLAMAAIHPTDAACLPLGVTTATAGTYTFSLDEEWTAFDPDMEHLYLEDLQEGTLTDLLLEDYSCSLAANTPAVGRFRLIAQHKETTTPTALDNTILEHPLISSIQGNLSLLGLDEADVYVYSVTGTCLYRGRHSGALSLPLATGTYLVSVMQGDETYTEHILIH